MFYFQPKELTNLILVSEMTNLSPIIDCNVYFLNYNFNFKILGC